MSIAFLAALWRACWQGALVIGLVGLVCRLAERRLPAAVRCGLWRLTYIKLLLALLPLGVVALPLLPAALPHPAASSTETRAVPHPLSSPAPDAAITPTASTAEVTPNAAHIPKGAAGLPEAFGGEPAVSNASMRGVTWQRALFALYLAGVGIVLVRLLWAAARTRRLLHGATPCAFPEAADIARELSARLGLKSVPDLLQSAQATSPFYAAGAIVLPADAAYPPEELRLILAHELAHVRRRDLVYEALGVAAQTLFFFHPFVLLARREERLARESAADALALQVTDAPPAQFGELLLSLALRPSPALAGAVGVVEGGSLLHRRLLALKETAMVMPRRRRLLVFVFAAAAAALVPWRVTHALDIQKPAATLVRTLPKGSHTITGQVRDDGGNPVADAGVGAALLPPGHRWDEDAHGKTPQLLYVRTDDAGRYTLSELPAGKYGILIVDARRIPAATRRHPGDNAIGRFATDSPKETTIRENEPRLTVNLTASRGVTLSGRVLDRKTGLPIPQVHVLGGREIPGEKSREQGGLDESVTDTHGRYFLRLPAGRVFADINDPRNWAAVSALHGSHFALKVGQSASYDFYLPASPKDEPTLRFVAPDGKPVMARVDFYPDNRKGSIAEDLTGEDGRMQSAHQVNAIADGAFRAVAIGRDLSAAGRFHLEKGNFVTTTYGATRDVRIAGGDTIRMTPFHAASLIGTIADASGNPIPDADIILTSLDGKLYYGGQDTLYHSDSAGRFRLPLYDDLAYFVTIRKAGFLAMEPLRPLTGKSPYHPAAGETRDLGILPLRRADGFITGRVLDEQGKPAARRLVAVEKDNLVSAVLSGADGAFRVGDMLPGSDYLLTVGKGKVMNGGGGALWQSNDYWYRTGVRAGQSSLIIVLRPAQQGKRLPASSTR